MTPLLAFQKALDGLGGPKLLAGHLRITPQALYKERTELQCDPSREVPPYMAVKLAHLCKIKEVPVTFGDLCPSVQRAADGQFNLRFDLSKHK